MNNKNGNSQAGFGASADRLMSARQRLRLPNRVRHLLPAAGVSGLRHLRAFIVTRKLLRGERFDLHAAEASSSECMSIVVPVHDAPDVLERCLNSLEKYAAAAEIVIVDDASQLAKTRTIIADYSERNRWTVVRNEAPKGHSEACRRGVELTARPYLCLLNSDTVVTPWCWGQVKEAFDHDRSIGALGPSTSTSKNEQQMLVASHCRDYWTDAQICQFAALLLTHPPQPTLLDLPVVTGFAFFIRRDLWQQFGGFDRNLPDYGNETELCARLRRAGYRAVWIRSAYVHHFGSRSYGATIGQKGILARKDAAHQYIAEHVNGFRKP